VGISGGVVFKGLNEWRFKTVNAHSVEKDRRSSAVGNTFKREDVDPCDWTLLPPQYLRTYLKSQGRFVEAGSADSMVRPGQMNGVAYWKPIAGAAQFDNNDPAPVNLGRSAGLGRTQAFLGLKKVSSDGSGAGGSSTKPPLPDVDTTAGLALVRTEEMHQQQFGGGASRKKIDWRAHNKPVPPPPARLQQSRAAKKKGKSAMQRMIDDEEDFEDDVDGEDAMVEMVSNVVDDLEEEAEHGQRGESDYDSDELASEDGSEEQASAGEGEFDEEVGDVPPSPLWDHDHDSDSETSENGEFGDENEEEENGSDDDDEEGSGDEDEKMSNVAQGWRENEEDEVLMYTAVDCCVLLYTDAYCCILLRIVVYYCVGRRQPPLRSDCGYGNAQELRIDASRSHRRRAEGEGEGDVQD
jgi:hypothetical protein